MDLDWSLQRVQARRCGRVLRGPRHAKGHHKEDVGPAFCETADQFRDGGMLEPGSSGGLPGEDPRRSPSRGFPGPEGRPGQHSGGHLWCGNRAMRKPKHGSRARYGVCVRRVRRLQTQSTRHSHTQVLAIRFQLPPTKPMTSGSSPSPPSHLINRTKFPPAMSAPRSRGAKSPSRQTKTDRCVRRHEAPFGGRSG